MPSYLIHKLSIAGLALGRIWSLAMTFFVAGSDVAWSKIDPSKFPDQRQQNRSPTQRGQPQRPVNTTQAPCLFTPMPN